MRTHTEVAKASMVRAGVIATKILGYVPLCKAGAKERKPTKNQRYPIKRAAIPKRNEVQF